MSRRARERAAALAVKRIAFARDRDDDRHLEDDESEGLDWLADEFAGDTAPYYLTHTATTSEGRIA